MFEGPLGCLVLGSWGCEGSKGGDSAIRRQKQMVGQEAKVKQLSAASSARSLLAPQRPSLVASPMRPLWPCPSLHWRPQSVLLISTQPPATDFSDLTLLSCSFAWSRRLGGLGSWGFTASRKALGCDLQPHLTLRPQAAESGQALSMGSQRGQSPGEAARGAKSQGDPAQPWKGNLTNLRPQKTTWRKGGGLGVGYDRIKQGGMFLCSD